MSEKIYVGNGRRVGKFGQIAIGLKASELPAPNDKGYINLIIGGKRDKDGEYWVAVNDYDPKEHKSEEKAERERQGFQPNDPLPENDLPF